MKFTIMMKKLGIRIHQSNNRVLGTLLGCIGGFILGYFTIISHQAILPIIGMPTTTTTKIIALVLSAGIGGNLTSYVGACIDIFTNEKTIVHFIAYCFKRTNF